MRILVTNDDGIRGVGIRHLVELAKEFGEVKVFAPDRERSCCSHAMTMREPLRAAPVSWEGVEAFEVSGFPVDCVNVGLQVGWPDGCDLVLSGINNGPNLGFDITYSGTAAGAMEGIINGIPSIAISMAPFEIDSPLYYETATAWLKTEWASLLEARLPDLTFLNINVPAIPTSELRGHRVARMGRRVYAERMEQREDPWGQTYWWQGGAVVLPDPQPGTDFEAVRDGYVSVTPVTLDWTDQPTFESLDRALSRVPAPK